ncbi:MAG: aromatic ring-hydroxylating dioxygenase subunit alpha [Betaproteobacteria bacterium]|nr:aromatic ring-hydroxylating dioxygenase subunit alpha [Betaproteobacteria bacterium]
MQSFKCSAQDLVDFHGGEISRELFVNADIYREEQERVFARAWLYVGHATQVRNPGDFIVSKMGEESVILARDRAGEIHVFLNTCRHRGMKVCRYDEGNTKTFMCPYHGWSYGLDGKLIGVPDYQEAYKPAFDREEWRLVEVAQMAIFRGTIWATWDKSAPSFEEYLGEARFALDHALCPWDGGDGETEVLGSTQRWIIPSNWKIVAENFAGDALHVVSHRSVDLAGIGPSEGEGRRDDPGRLVVAAYPGGHGVMYGVRDATTVPNDYRGSRITAEYFRHCWKKRRARRGPTADIVPLVGTIFPNMSFHGQQPRTILVAHPLGVDRTEMWRIYFTDRGAPAEVKDFLRRYYVRYAGPAGMTEQDDMENWNYATAASRGVIARQYPYHYKAGLGAAKTSDLIPGIITDHPITTEQNPRVLYQRWAEYMDAGSWDHLLGKQSVIR